MEEEGNYNLYFFISSTDVKVTKKCNRKVFKFERYNIINNCPIMVNHIGTSSCEFPSFHTLLIFFLS